MARTRAFLPPPTCTHCGGRPALGETLFNTGGTVWICAACLTQQEPGQDVVTKMASRSIRAERSKALSRRAKAAGEIEDAAARDHDRRWHEHAMVALQDNGQRQMQNAVIINGEVVPRSPGYLKDTLADPDLAAIEASEARGGLLLANDVVALGLDVAKTAGASNTHEKIVAHEIALAHKVAMQQAHAALHERDPAIELKRLQISARMMATAQQGVLTLQKLKTGGTQNVIVSHVHVEAGGQAIVGSVKTERRED